MSFLGWPIERWVPFNVWKELSFGASISELAPLVMIRVWSVNERACASDAHK